MVNPRNNGKEELPPGLSIIHSNHLEELRKVAVGWIKAHPLKVFETEEFIVQSKGMAQWLKLALAGDDGCGISAGVEVQLPGRYVWKAYRSVLGNDTIPMDSPYDRERLVWRIFRLLPFLRESVFLPLNRFLEDDKDQRKQYQLACQLADLYDQYQVYRADWLGDWAASRNQIINSRGKVLELSMEQQWQAQLWRRIKADVSHDFRNISRADLHRRFLQQAETLQNRPDTLSSRVIVFGVSSLPKQVLETLHSISSFCQVLLFVLNPCRHFWANIIEDRELLRIENARHQPKSTIPDFLSPDLLHQHVNPLLAAWGKQGRDYIGLLYGFDEAYTYEKDFAQIDLFDDFIEPGTKGTLLQQVQQAILDLEPLPRKDEDKKKIDKDDFSISFQVAHSRQREVEILQDHILQCFGKIEGLNPRDFIVMTPDIEAYAPHIEAVFGNLAPDDPRFIPFSIADKPDKKSVPMLKALEKLLHLPDSRTAVSDLMDLLEVPAFRERFGLCGADLPKLHQWIRGAGISWGLNPEQRTNFGLPTGLEQNTWDFGLKRMLLGYAVGKGQAWNGIEPYDEVGGLEACLVGSLSAILEQMEILWKNLTLPGSPHQWCSRIQTLVNDFFLPQGSDDLLIINRVNGVVEGWMEECSAVDFKGDLTLAVVRDFFLGKMVESSMSQRFLAGMVNFGTLMPMRAIPFKVVCLLGINDNDFPRSHPPLDFDLMAEKGFYRPGDRSRREDDRYLFLEALLSAREKLYISHVGRDVRDNSERMPSVLVGQLQDYINGGWQLNSNGEKKEMGELVDHLTSIHPLQPFGRAYFLKNQPKLFTYAHEWRSCLNPRELEKTESILELPGFQDALSLNLLIGFLKNPTRFFFNHRLSIYFDDTSIISQDQEPFALDFLAPFGLGNLLLGAGVSAEPGKEKEAVLMEAHRLTNTGELPMAGFGKLAAGQLAEPVLAMLDFNRKLSSQWPIKSDPMEISIPFASEGSELTSLDDWLDRLYETDSEKDFSRFARWEFYPKSILDKNGRISRLYSLVSLWVRHVSGCAHGIDLSSFLIAPDGIAGFAPLKKEEANEFLMTIMKFFSKAFTHPLPITAKTATAYLNKLIMDKDEEKARAEALRVYEGDNFNFQGELGYDLYLQRVYPRFDVLWQAQDNIFPTLAAQLYEPLVRAVTKEA